MAPGHLLLKIYVVPAVWTLFHSRCFHFVKTGSPSQLRERQSFEQVRLGVQSGMLGRRRQADERSKEEMYKKGRKL